MGVWCLSTSECIHDTIKLSAIYFISFSSIYQLFLRRGGCGVGSYVTWHHVDVTHVTTIAEGEDVVWVVMLHGIMLMSLMSPL